MKDLFRIYYYWFVPPVTRDIHDPQPVEEAALGPEPARGHGVHDGVDQGEDAVRVEVEPEDVKDVCDKMNDDMMTHLSAMAPDTIVVAVVAKDIWKMKVVKVGPILTSDQSEASIGPRVDQSQLT